MNLEIFPTAEKARGRCTACKYDVSCPFRQGGCSLFRQGSSGEICNEIHAESCPVTISQLVTRTNKCENCLLKAVTVSGETIGWAVSSFEPKENKV